MSLPPTDESVTSTESSAPAQPAPRIPAQTVPQQPVWIPSPQTTQPVPQQQQTSPQVPLPLPQTQQPDPQTQPQAPQTDETVPQFNPAPPTQSPDTPPAPQQQQPPPIFIPSPQSSSRPPDAGSKPALRISPQPMDANAASIQAQLADQTDGQLTQGSASQIRSLGNSPISVPSNPANGSQDQTQTANNTSQVHPVWSDTQYTPSAQEAATGAYSAQKAQNRTKSQQNQTQPAAQPPAQQPVQSNAPATDLTPPPGEKKPKRSGKSVPTLVTAPTDQSAPVPPPETQPDQSNPASAQPGISDEELEQRNLPPLRGPWVKVRRQPQVVSPRDEAEQQLRSLESGYSGWMGGDGSFNFRSGDLGYDRLASLEAPFEFSAPLGYHARFTIVAKPVFLDSGQADGTSIITVQESTTSGRSLVTIPTPLGTDTNTGPTTGTTTTTPTPPPQQNAAGVGGEIQLSFPHLAVAAGYTPLGFLVSNWNARGNWRPANGPFTLTVSRDSVKDTQLSYAGLRDPGTASLSFPGTIWGGVMANQANIQYARGDAMSGFYVGVGGQYLTGYQVETNSRFDGTGGAYWRVKTIPEYGNLSIGANFFGMHYAHNEQAFTFGMGGYFSPQAYFLANIPVTWSGHYMTKWHYEILTGLGVQAFQQDSTPIFPLAGQKASEIGLNNAALPALTSVGANYNLRGNVSYQIGPHWFAGGFVSANNSRNYATGSAGFSIHYMFRAQPAAVLAPTGLFSNEGLRPFTVP